MTSSEEGKLAKIIEAATPMKPKKGAEVGQSSEIVISKTVESILYN